MRTESEEQEKQIGDLENCFIKTTPSTRGTGITVLIRPGKNEEGTSLAKDSDFEEKKLGQSYFMVAPELFPDTKEMLKKHPIYGQFTEAWEVTLLKDNHGYDAPIVGYVRNSFKGRGDLANFVGTETGVCFKPNFNDVQGERSQKAVSSLRESFDDWEAQANGFLLKLGTGLGTPRQPLMPIYELVSLAEYKPELNVCNKPVTVDPAHPRLVGLNESQLEAVTLSVAHKVSAMWGGPGTGKSQALAKLVAFLLAQERDAKETVLVVSVANVAVDAILDKCVSVYSSAFPGQVAPFARVYSTSQILAQYYEQDFKTLDKACHIENLRIRKANEDGGRFSTWLDAQKMLRKFGCLLDLNIDECYRKQGKELNRLIFEELKEVRVAFCTAASCPGPTFVRAHPADGIAEWVFPATTIVFDEFGTATRPQLLIPLMTFVDTCRRLILAGDPYQLDAFMLSETAKKTWPKSLLKAIIDLGWPCGYLNKQYRMPEELYRHLNTVIYESKGTISSAFSFSNPNAHCTSVLQALPLSFVVNNQKRFTLTTCLQFVDVADGVQQKIEAGSSSNFKELETVEAMVMAFLAKGFTPADIAVVTGYARQKKLFMLRAQENGWSQVRQVLTVDSCQGDEYKIVILSLVTTKGNSSGFMSLMNRANVATSRQQGALYLVGQFEYWSTVNKKQASTMQQIVTAMINSCNARKARLVVRDGENPPAQ